jgi:hypothetical protein
MYTTSHSWSSYLKNVNGRVDSTQTTKWTWSDTQIGSRPIKSLVLGFEKGGAVSLLGSIPHHSRLEYTSLKLV